MLFILIVIMPDKYRFNLPKKVPNNNLMIISKQYTHLQTMTETHAEFKKNWHKTVVGVAHIIYLILKVGGKDRKTQGWNYGKLNRLEILYLGSRGIILSV